MAGKQRQILVIEDEPSICEGCRMVLSEMGYSVDACHTGSDGCDGLLKGHYDLALLDMKLPDMDGIDILRRVGGEKPDVDVIVMTGYSTVKNAVEAMKSGAFDYIAKPFTDDELLIAVQRAMENKRLKEENRPRRHQLAACRGQH